MSRSNNRLGWDTVASSAIDVLNEGMPYASFYLPASMWVNAKEQTAQWTPALQINASLKDTVDCWNFYNTEVSTEIYCKFNTFGIPIDLTTPEFRLFPEFFQNDVTPKPNPSEYAYFQYSLGNNVDGASLDYSLEGEEINAQTEIQDKNLSFAADDTTKGIQLGNLDGPSALSGTLKNNFRMQLERWNASPSDTFLNSVYFSGMIVQYKTDFSNVAQIPVA